MLKIVRVIFENIELGLIKIKGFEAGWVWPTYRIAKVAVDHLRHNLRLSLTFPGSGTTAFQGITIFLGIILSFGSSSVISNLLAGLFVIYRRSVNVGDWIKVNDKGRPRWNRSPCSKRSLRSVKNELISMPELPTARLGGGQLHAPGRDRRASSYTPASASATRSRQRKGRGHAARGGRAHARLPDGSRDRSCCAASWPIMPSSTRSTPFPTRLDALPRLESDLHANILDIFNENQVQIMTPSYMADPEVPKIAPTGRSERGGGKLASAPARRRREPETHGAAVPYDGGAGVAGSASGRDVVSASRISLLGGFDVRLGSGGALPLKDRKAPGAARLSGARHGLRKAGLPVRDGTGARTRLAESSARSRLTRPLRSGRARGAGPRRPGPRSSAVMASGSRFSFRFGWSSWIRRGLLPSLA